MALLVSALERQAKEKGLARRSNGAQLHRPDCIVIEISTKNGTTQIQFLDQRYFNRIILIVD
jgi:hypothetical protein